MAKFIFSVLCSLILASCAANSIGENPTVDGQEMMYRSMSALKDGDPTKANNIIGDYIDYYTTADDSQKTEFCRASSETYWHRMMNADNPDWTPFFEKMAPVMQWYMESGASLSSLPNYPLLQAMQAATLGTDE